MTGLGMPQDLPRAYAQFTEAAQAGDPLALFNLGYMALHGMHPGVKPPGRRDIDAARRMFMAAANAGVGAGYNAIGVLYLTSAWWRWGLGGMEGVFIEMAVTQFGLAANLSHADGLYNLGLLYANGGWVGSCPRCMWMRTTWKSFVSFVKSYKENGQTKE
jgi:TPR repeat protein